MSDRLSSSARHNSKVHYAILITVIIAAGLSQGLLLPVLSILLEQQGVSSSLNGLNAAALYIGSFGMTLIAERALGAAGFKKLIIGGGTGFALLPLAGDSFLLCLVILMVSGGLVGSFFSLGLAYAADILPRNLLPAAGIASSFHYSIGSIAGPGIGGLLLEAGQGGGVFGLMGLFYILFGLAGLLFSPRKQI
ncbi:hypothetical protein GCM10010912_05720 [Paenibacillus albidus]|uniref:MFS transporter n=1 Tax=Paenibacillus albidus TaxID=2041023 RepID=A0A917F9V5_9BACL|nr:MFS transporter [Paenibacillus albidus]GGF63496.1 hypothetical protein GCM10010912_05720 [Paenibacillus albidus]